MFSSNVTAQRGMTKKTEYEDKNEDEHSHPTWRIAGGILNRFVG
jgi:hypothetical protein